MNFWEAVFRGWAENEREKDVNLSLACFQLQNKKFVQNQKKYW